jgi:hypothetical protein
MSFHHEPARRTQPITTTTGVCYQESDLLRVNLKPRWYPDVEDTDVDNSDENCSANHDPSRTPSIRHDDTDTVNDDLQKQLNLNTPPEQDGEVKSEACGG